MRNKLLAMLLALCMVMTMLPAVAFAGDEGGEDDENQNPTACSCEECTENSHNCTTDSPCNATGCTTCNPNPNPNPPGGGDEGKCQVSECTYIGTVHTGDHTFTCTCPETGEDVHQNHQTTYTGSEVHASGKCPACRGTGTGGDNENDGPGGTTGGGATSSGAVEAPEGHCQCEDTSCTALSHRGEALGTIAGDNENSHRNEISYGAKCVAVPEDGGALCNACKAYAAGLSGNNNSQGGDKKDDEQKPAQPTTPTAPAVDPNAPQKAEDFIDVQPGQWYNNDVTTMIQKGWFIGQTGGRFAPKDPTTGAEVVVILSRVLGYDLVTTGSAWASEATEWAAAHGLSEGISITTTGGLARQDLILMLWRAADKPASSYALSFTDIGDVSGDALTALRWAVENGIVNGNPDGTANPGGATKRCEMAALMVRYDKAVNG